MHPAPLSRSSAASHWHAPRILAPRDSGRAGDSARPRPLLVRARRQGRPGGAGPGGSADNDKEKKDLRQNYLVKVVTPPQRDLGLHCLPQNTQCGESIDIEGETFIVSGVTYTYRLCRGRYEPGEKRLDVQSTGRYLVNLYLQDMLERS